MGRLNPGTCGRKHARKRTFLNVSLDNAELLALSGPRNPYSGRLGVIEEGALADMLVVGGDPLADLNVVAKPDKNFAVIIKDGKVYKNTLH